MMHAELCSWRSVYPGPRPAARRVLACAAGALLALGALGCDFAAEGGTAAQEAGEVPLELDTVSFQGYRVGTREFEVRAAHAQVVAREKIVMDRVHIAFIDKGRGPIRIEAPRAELDLLTDDFVLRGGVTGETQDGDQFATDSLQYVRQARRLYSDDPVKVKRPKDELAGEGMEIDVDTRLLTIRQVRVVVGGA